MRAGVCGRCSGSNDRFGLKPHQLTNSPTRQLKTSPTSQFTVSPTYQLFNSSMDKLADLIFYNDTLFFSPF